MCNHFGSFSTFISWGENALTYLTIDIFTEMQKLKVQHPSRSDKRKNSYFLIFCLVGEGCSVWVLFGMLLIKALQKQKVCFVFCQHYIPQSQHADKAFESVKNIIWSEVCFCFFMFLDSESGTMLDKTSKRIYLLFSWKTLFVHGFRELSFWSSNNVSVWQA